VKIIGKILISFIAVLTLSACSSFNSTPILSVPTTNPDGLDQLPPADRLDYAMAIAPKVYNRLPYMNESEPSGGEYSGCADTNDFNTVVYYAIGHPLDTVTSAFDRYFQEEQWAFTDATTESISNEVREVSYEVYRFLPSETPAFERLRIIMRDESSFQGADYIDVRLFLVHIETKSNLGYFGDFSCRLNNRWLWNSLYE